MAEAVLAVEEVQKSLGTADADAVFEEDAEFEADIEFAQNGDHAIGILEASADSYTANDQLQNGILDNLNGDHEYSGRDRDEEILSELDDEMDVSSALSVLSEPNSEEEDSEMETGEEEEEEELEEQEEEEAEEAEVVDVETNDAEEEADDEDDEDAEGVGAVKIQPGLLDQLDEDAAFESGEDSNVSLDEEEDDDDLESKESSDAEIDGQWQSAAEEEEEEPANPNRCVFCQQDEDSDPSEIFEIYLACEVCGDNAHQQCARNSDALKPEDEAEKWICPDCVANNLQPEPTVTDHELKESQEPEALDVTTQRISRDRVPGDLLPSQRGTIKPDSHSVFNQLIAPEDPMDGSRLLRKRKASSDLASIETGSVSPVRTRNREKDSGIPASGDSGMGSLTQDVPTKESSQPVEPMEPAGAGSNLVNGHNKKNEALASPRASRSLRPKISPKVPPVSMIEKTSTSIKLRISVAPAALQDILSKLPKPLKKRSRGGDRRSGARSRPAASRRRPVPAAPSTIIAPSSYAQPFYSLHDKEVDELKSKPYGGILTEVEADTTLTLPKPEHRRQFDEARQNAEEEWKARVATAAEAAAKSGLKKARKVSGPASQIEYIEFGQYQIDIWYAAPYPEEYSRNKALFICEFCLKYMESDIVAWRHKTKCHWKHPPGDEIYRDGKIMIFEVDGRKNPLYCQNLCLLAKLFLGSKTLYYDVEPFLFYVMTEYDELGCHFVGYFSKEKRPSSLNNVSCILVLPIHQRKGYGHLLIDFSYLLTRVEKKTGSPEKPLSDMGLVSYRNYWRLILCYYLQHYTPGDQMPSIRQMSDELGLTPDDVISALDALGSMVRDSTTGTYAFKLRTQYYKEVIHQHESKNYARLNPKGLVWTPYVMGRGNASSFDHAPPLHNVSQREEEEDEESVGQVSQVNGSQREFVNLDGTTNGDTESLAESLGNLSTKPDTQVMAEGANSRSSSTHNQNGNSNKPSYFDAAASIPAIRFSVFPPPPGTRKTPAAPRPSASRPSGRSRPSLGGGTPSRPKPRNRTSVASSRRSSVTRPVATPHRAGSHKKKTPGGTGRGPGRWPRGTSKADFGNADSGPGLPPRLLKRKSRLGNEVLLGDEANEGEGEQEENSAGTTGESADGSIVMSGKPRSKRDRTSRFGMGKPSLDGKSIKTLGKSLGKGKGKGKGPILDDDDIDEPMDGVSEPEGMEVDTDAL